MPPLDIPPGIVRSTTPHSLGARWVDGLNFRFVSGKAQKVGGWVLYFDDQMLGKCRAIFGWLSSVGNRIANAGTTRKLYAFTDELEDITPLDATGQLTNPFSTVNDSATVTVADSAHGRREGAYVYFENATAVGGITIDGWYEVVTVVDANTYTITHSAPATSTNGPLGGTVDFEYELNPGFEDTSLGLGYGAGPYGEETYGTERTGASDGILFEARFWFFSKWGNFLLAQVSGGTIYYWDEPASASVAVALTNAPTAVRSSFVTAEGFLFALGTTTPMTLQWPTRDDYTVWTVTDENDADERELAAGNRLIVGTALTDINLLWSDTATYIAQYIGGYFVYDTRVISANTGIVGPKAFAIYGKPATAFWMSPTEILMFSGTVTQVPRSLDVRDYIFGRLNRLHANKSHLLYNPHFGEIVGFYVSNDSTDNEPDSWWAVSLEDWSWSLGACARTAATYMPSAQRQILMVSPDGYTYEHENGVDAAGAALRAYLATGTLTLDGGTTDMNIDRWIPDTERQAGEVTVTFRTKERPRSTTWDEEESFTLEETDIEIDIHMSGRHVQFEIETNVLGGDLRLGAPIFEVSPGGSRG